MESEGKKNNGSEMRIGVDIGGMTIKIGIVKDGCILGKEVIETDSRNQSAEKIVGNIAAAIKTLLHKNGLEEAGCKAIGIACPGTVDAASGTVLYSNNIEWEQVPIVDLLMQYTTIPAALANDADAAALGEVLYGAAKGRNNAVLLTLGTGVGGGVIMDKKIFSGYGKGGCELGHTVIERKGKPCTCGRRGCLEMYASASALMRSARVAAAENKDSLMNGLCGGNVELLDGKMAFEALMQGDAVAAGVIDEYEENLSIGIANLINIFRPEIFILGGGVSAQGEYLTAALQKKVDKMCFGGDHGDIASIVTSQLGNDAGIIGAAYLR